MKVFVSYHGEDRHLVETMAEILPDTISMYYWDASNVPGEPDWESIDAWLEDSDVVLVLVTAKTLERAISVGQEIGRARTLDKQIIPIVAHDVSPSRLGSLKGITAIRFDEHEPEDGFAELGEYLEHYRRNLRNKRIMLGGLAAAGLMWLSRRKSPPQGQPPFL